MRKKIKLIGITAALICAGVSRVARIAERSKEYIQTHYANPNLNGAMIAADTGYTSERTFSRAFVKIMGVTPGDFKKNVKEKNRH